MMPASAKLRLKPRDARLFMIADKRWKLIHAIGFRPMLFDRLNDPDQFHDLGTDPAYADQCERLSGALAQWGLRVSQRTTRSEQQIDNARGKAARRGILIGVSRRNDIRCRAVERLSSGQAITRRSIMPGRRLLPLVLAVLAGSFFAAPSPAQNGEQPIRIIFPFAPGGSGDTVARLIASKMSGALNRPVIVENRTGADGRIGVKLVKDAAPDGSTLLLTPIAPVIYQHFYTHLDYDPIADFAPLSQLGTFDFGIAVGPQTDAKTLKDLVDWAKANPADANYAIPGAGTLPHFLGVMFGRAAKIDLRPVPYHGSAAGLTDLVAGHIPIEITTTADLVQMAEAGRIRVLATSNRRRSPFLPNVPTLREAGYDLVASGWYGMFAPAKTPPEVIARLNKAIVDAVRSSDVEHRFLAFGLQPTGTSAAAFADIQKEQLGKMSILAKASGFKPEE